MNDSTDPSTLLRSSPSLLVDAFAIATGTWWLYSMVIVYAGLSFDRLMAGLFLPILATVGLAAWLLRPSGPPVARPSAPPEVPAWLPWGLVPVAIGLILWSLLRLPFAVAWVPAVAFSALLVRCAGPLRGPASVLASNRDAVALVMGIGLCMVIVCGFNRPEVDDAYNVNAIISALENPSLAVLSFDGMHGDLDAPIQQLIHRPQTFEILIAALSRLTGGDPRTLYWLWMPLLTVPFVAMAVWRTMKSMAPEAAWFGLWMLFLIWWTWGDNYRVYGSYTFGRLSQGKPIFICMIVPAVIYCAARFADRPTPRNFTLLMLTQCAAGGYTSSALLLGPIVAGLALLAHMRPTVQGLRNAALGLLASGPLFAGLLAMKLELSGVGGLAHDGWMRDMSAVLGETSRAPIALFAMVAFPTFLVGLRAATAPWAARFVALSLLLVYNGVVAQFLAENVAELFSWRLYWVVPVPLLAALGAAVAAQAALASRKRTHIGGTLLTLGVLTGAFWTAGAKPIEARYSAWKWWAPKTRISVERLAQRVVRSNSPDDMVLLAPRVAERVTNLTGRPKMTSVRQSYLTNLTRYWGKEQGAQRQLLMDFAEDGKQPGKALDLLDAWCIDTAVVRRMHRVQQRQTEKYFKKRGFKQLDKRSGFFYYERSPRKCTPEIPGPKG